MNPPINTGIVPCRADVLESGIGQDSGAQFLTPEHRRRGNVQATNLSERGRVEAAQADKPNQLRLPDNLHAAEFTGASSLSGQVMGQGTAQMPATEEHWRLPVVPGKQEHPGTSSRESLQAGNTRDAHAIRELLKTEVKKAKIFINLASTRLLESGEDNDLKKCSDLAFRALPGVQRALEAYQELPRKGRKENLENQQILLRTQHRAAYLALHNSYVESPFDKSQKAALIANPELGEALRDWITKEVDFFREKLHQVKEADRLLVNNMNFHLPFCSTGNMLEKEAHIAAMITETNISAVQVVNMAQIIGSYGIPEITSAVESLRVYTNEFAEPFMKARDALFEGKGSAEDYRLLMGISEELIGYGETFCLVAAGQFHRAQSNSELWQSCMDTASGVSDLSSSYRRIAEEFFNRKDSGWVPDSVEQALSRPGDINKAAEPSGGKAARKARGKTKTGTGGTSTTGTGSSGAAKASPTSESKDEASLRRIELTRKVNRHLKQWRAVPAGDDPIAVARAMPGKDTQVLDALSGDPLSVAHQKRNWVDSWIGSVQQLNGLRQQLLKLGDDPNTIGQIAELDRCLERRERMDSHLQRQKVDSLKVHGFPKAHHLLDLMEQGEIQPHGVSAPVRLSSDGDVGNRGTLFEIRIKPKPLSDGQPSPALYLHLHIDRAVSERELDKIDGERFMAVHLKTQAQRGLGRRWEQLSGALGTVHRGKVEAELRQQILDMAARKLD